MSCSREEPEHAGTCSPSVSTPTEVAMYRDCAINLPLLLYTNPNILTSVLNCDTWTFLFDDGEREHLRQYLPHFASAQDTYHLQEETVQLLLSGRNFKFGNPVNHFYRRLQLGYFNPRIAELLAIEHQASYTKYRQKRQTHYRDLLSEILFSRKAVLHEAVHSHTAFVGSIATGPYPVVVCDRERRLKESAKREYEKIWLSVKLSTQDYSNSSDEEESFEDVFNRHKEAPSTDLILRDMLNTYRKRRDSHILYPDLITEKVTLRSVQHRVDKTKRRRTNESARRKALSLTPSKPPTPSDTKPGTL
eukprot:sb/3467236/